MFSFLLRSAWKQFHCADSIMFWMQHKFNVFSSINPMLNWSTVWLSISRTLFSASTFPLVCLQTLQNNEIFPREFMFCSKSQSVELRDSCRTVENFFRPRLKNHLMFQLNKGFSKQQWSDLRGRTEIARSSIPKCGCRKNLAVKLKLQWGQ